MRIFIGPYCFLLDTIRSQTILLGSIFVHVDRSLRCVFWINHLPWVLHLDQVIVYSRCWLYVYNPVNLIKQITQLPMDTHCWNPVDMNLMFVASYRERIEVKRIIRVILSQEPTPTCILVCTGGTLLCLRRF